jgi:hypothetical protein
VKVSLFFESTVKQLTTEPSGSSTPSFTLTSLSKIHPFSIFDPVPITHFSAIREFDT